MLRDFRINGGQAPDAMHKAAAAMKTGMAVIKNDTNMTADLSSSAVSADVWFVNKERVPSGVNAARGDMSDYDKDFTEIAAGEMVKLVKYLPGERFATDQVDEAITSSTAMNKRLAFKNGLAVVATAASIYLFKGFVNDNGHQLAVIEVSDTAASN